LCEAHYGRNGNFEEKSVVTTRCINKKKQQEDIESKVLMKIYSNCNYTLFLMQSSSEKNQNRKSRFNPNLLEDLIIIFTLPRKKAIFLQN
jgi:predicted nucleic-acid-binding Zn-ribbon protein